MPPRGGSVDEAVMPSGRAALGRLKGYIQAEEAATSPAILVPGD